MKNITKRALLLATCALTTTLAFSQGYPNRQITIIVPFPAGGTTDVVTRMVANDMAITLKQPIIVENRGGANGNVGSAAAAKSAPDGYTLLATGVGSNAVNHGIYKVMPYDSRKDFSHITLMTTGPNVLVVNKNFPANNLKEFVALVKANPGKYNYAAAGMGASGHMAMELLKMQAGLDIQLVPYRGGAPAMNDVIAGQVPMMFINQDMAFAQSKGGNVKMIGAASEIRNPSEPNLPTIAEQGYAGFSAVSWNALAAPAGTPKEIIDILNAAAKKALANPAIKDKLIEQGFVMGGNTPAEQAKFVSDEMDKWKKVAETAKIVVE
jgi:tripartite-type tricarboxylate transporter receptor subunit TctC